MLYEDNFLKQLDYTNLKEKYVRLTALDINNLPRQRIEGVVTSGSITLDGKSAAKRSCNLSLVVKNEEDPISEIDWAFKNRFELEMGVKNNIDPNYPDIIWFKQGIFVINSFSKQESVNNLTVSVQGMDKLCLLDGSVGGIIPAQTDVGTIEDWDAETQRYVITKLPLKQIIINVLLWYGQERPENIIIEDIAEFGYELWEYRGDQPMYMIFKPGTNNKQNKVASIIFNNNKKVYVNGVETLITEIPRFYSFNTLDPSYNDTATKITLSSNSTVQCYIAKIEYGETAGYAKTPLVYPKDLIANKGETITSILDKIVAVLGEFEYLYDTYGRFVFRKKRNYLQELFSPFDGKRAEATMITTPYSYEFEDEKLFASISESPDMKNLKNVFIIYGSREGSGGGKIDIHAHYAVCQKPTTYTTLNGEVYTTELYDWRELIYQMALDFYSQADSETGNPNINTTGYEPFYMDLFSFWRDLYDPNGSEEDYYTAEEYSGTEYQYWTKKIHSDPTTLNFWFDFLDFQGPLGKYSIDKIGFRPIVKNENTVNSIYYNKTPEVQFIRTSDKMENNIWEEGEFSYSPINISENEENLFSVSSQGISAIEKANELFYQHLCCTEGLSLSCVPIYSLEPNTCINIKGRGKYQLTSINHNLAASGMMSLSATKIIEQIIV